MIGTKINHYKILEKIGEGGMGVVYRAEDTKLKREVAIKFLPHSLKNNTLERKRFEVEARAAAALNHPNITTIHSIEETDDELFIIMEIIDGHDLKSILYEKQLSEQEIINIAFQIVQGLQSAHNSGVIHRDIKPANIMLTRSGTVKLMDFGLAKMLSLGTQLTQDGHAMGTISYMSPEQTRGGDVDVRTDIWAFGVILYEMLAGSLPFRGEYEQAVVYSILNEEPVPLTKFRAGIPLQLQRIVMKCLEKNPENRYQNADDLISELMKIKEPSEIDIAKLGKTGKNITSFVPKVLVLVLIIVVGYFVVTEMLPVDMASTNKEEASIAVLPFKNISSDPHQEYFCEGMTEQIISNLSRVQNLKVISRTSVSKFKNSIETIPEIAAILNVKFILEGSVRKSQDFIRVTTQLINAEDDSHVWAEDFDKQLDDVFKIQDDISDRVISYVLRKLPSNEIIRTPSKQTNNIQAYDFYLRGRYYHEQKLLYSEDEESFKLAKMMFEKAIEHDPSFALPYAALADIYHTYFINKPNQRKEILGLQTEYLNKAFSLDSTLAYNYLVKGRIHQINEEIDEAFESFNKAVQIAPNAEWMNYSFGSFLFGRGLCYEAIHFIDKTIKVDPLNPRFYIIRAISNNYLGNFEKSESDYKKAVELQPKFIPALVNYAHLLIEIDRLEEAENVLTQIEEIQPIDNFLKAKFLAAKDQRKTALDLMGKNQNVQIFSLLGMKEEALFLIENSLFLDNKSRTSYYWLYKTNPVYIKIRDDLRFQKLLFKHKKIYEENKKRYRITL